AIHHSEDRQEIFDLVQVAQLLGGFQSLLDFFAVMGCDSKTKAAHQDVPPDGNESSFGGAFLMCRLSSTHFQKIFFSRSIAIIEKQTGNQAELARGQGNQEAAVKQLSRLIHNPRLRPKDFAEWLCRQALEQVPLTGKVRMTIDWTTEDDQHLLVISLVV